MEVGPGGAHVACEKFDALKANERWFVVNSQPKREEIAFTLLANQGFRVFMPRQRKTVRHARKTTAVIAPVFPGYIFVALDLARHRWRSINGTFGVSRILMAAGLPQPVPTGVVEALSSATNSPGLMATPERLLKEGDPIRLLAGPFADQLGRLDRYDDQGRVRVLLQIMGCHVTVRTRFESVAAA